LIIVGSKKKKNKITMADFIISHKNKKYEGKKGKKEIRENDWGEKKKKEESPNLSQKKKYDQILEWRAKARGRHGG